MCGKKGFTFNQFKRIIYEMKKYYEQKILDYVLVPFIKGMVEFL